MSTPVHAIAHTDADLQLATFFVNGLCLALEIGEIQEIMRSTDITPVPFAPLEVKGVINLRGEVATVLGLREVLGVEEAGAQDIQTRILIVRSEGESIGLVVDRIGDIVPAGHGCVLPPPPNVDSVDGRFFRGVYPRENDIIVILNLHEVLSVSTAAKAA
jgi:purine-binding chemotaxis protein CheW